MEISGKVNSVLALQTGNGKNGIWKKQEFILETGGQIPRKICFSLWGDKVDQFLPLQGEDVEVMFDLESREFNGRWYTDAKAWKVVKKGGVREATPKEVMPPEDYELPGESDLPF